MILLKQSVLGLGADEKTDNAMRLGEVVRSWILKRGLFRVG